MGLAELFFSMIVVIVALIGVARGYAKELGTTIIILVAIFLLTFIDRTFGDPVRSLSARVFGASEGDTNLQDLILSTGYTLFFAALVFAGYAGKTLEFSGKPAPPPQGTLISLVVGLLNGYLVAGTLWYYQDRFNYPLQGLGWFQTNFSETAQQLIELLPQHILPSPLYWMLPAALLLLLRVRG